MLATDIAEDKLAPLADALIAPRHPACRRRSITCSLPKRNLGTEAFRARNGKFESTSLQRKVGCEPELARRNFP